MNFLRRSLYGDAFINHSLGESLCVNEIAKAVGIDKYVSTYAMQKGWLGCEKCTMTAHPRIFVNDSPFCRSNGYTVAKTLIGLKHKRDAKVAFKHSTSEDLADAIYELEIQRLCTPRTSGRLMEEIHALEVELTGRGELRTFHGTSENMNSSIREVFAKHPLRRLLVNVNRVTLTEYKTDGVCYIFHRRNRLNSIAFPFEMSRLQDLTGIDLVEYALAQKPVFNTSYTTDTVKDRDLITRQEEIAHARCGFSK